MHSDSSTRPVSRRLLLTAASAKVVATAVRYYVIHVVYDGVADAGRYATEGQRLAGQIRSGELPEKATRTGTDFMEFVSGVVYAVGPPSQIYGFVAFSALSFLGLYLLFRAFVIGVPDGDHRRFALLVFFLPTMLFWPSSIGKEAAITLGLGLAAFGGARLYRRLRWGYLPLVAGVGLVYMIRPHMGVLFVAAFGFGYLLRPAVPGQERASVRWAAGLVAAAVVVTMLVGTLEEVLPVGEDDGGSIFERIVETTEDRTSTGGSAFDNRPVTGLSDIPPAMVTVPFRPFPWEVLDNPQALIAGIEGLVLLALVVSSVPRMRRLPRTIWRRPMVVMAVAYSVGFCIAFSSVGNFGILVRQRAQLLPFLAILLCLPARGATEHDVSTPVGARDRRRTTTLLVSR